MNSDLEKEIIRQNIYNTFDGGRDFQILIHDEYTEKGPTVFHTKFIRENMIEFYVENYKISPFEVAIDGNKNIGLIKIIERV